MNLLNRVRFLTVIGSKSTVRNTIQNNPSILNTQSVNYVKKHHYSSDSDENRNDWIQSLDVNTKQRIQHIQNELLLFGLQGQKVPKPEWLSMTEYNNILEMSISRRRTYYSYLHGKYHRQDNNKIKKRIRETLWAENEEDPMNLMENQSKPNHIKYGLGANALITRISKHQIARWKNRNLVRAYYQNEPPLVFDFEFVNTMSKRETESTVKQINRSFSALRENKSPYVMHLCNLKEGSHFWRRLEAGFPGFQKLPIMISPKDVHELFPSGTEKLIYLTPDAEQVLEVVEPNCGFIIGAIVDKGDKKPYTLAKAKKLNIQTARLPVDGFVKFRAQKALAFNHVTKILLEAKRSNNWKKAFAHIPTRKLM